jgi:hypothetical protein
VLAYVFWHVAAPGADAYESRLTAFHDVIGVPSAWFAVPALPWMPGPGYEDWYLVDDWTALGELNTRAISGPRRAPHDAAAARAAWGIAGVYRLARGAPALSEVRFAAWRSKPAGEPYESFEASLPGLAVWQRQMTLGPTPEYAIHAAHPLDGDVTYPTQSAPHT